MLTYFLYVKNSVAESHGVLGHYCVTTLSNNYNSKIELFAVETRCYEKFPLILISLYQYGIRLLDNLCDTDYEEILVDWWNNGVGQPPTKDFLPDDGKGGLLCMMEIFLYVQVLYM
jgi:hypothetical protein